MSQKTKINNHVFHEFYSPLFLNRDYLFNRYPLRIPANTRLSILGAPKSNEENAKPVEFENEEEVLKYYKTQFLNLSRLTEDEYNELGSDNICKNYFVVPENLFFKYKNYFNGMIKHTVLNFDYRLKIEGEYKQYNDCECSSSSSSSSSPSIESSYFCCHQESHPSFPCNRPDSLEFANSQLTLGSSNLFSERIDLGLKPFFRIDGPDITEIENLLQNSFDLSSSSSSNEIKNIPSIQNNFTILNEEENDCCYCPPCEIVLSEDENIRNRADQYNCEHEMKGTLEVKIEYDGSKIFEDENLENRFGGINHQRFLRFDLNDDSKTEDLLFVKDRNLYEQNWVLNPNWRSIHFTEKKKFQLNSTLINDPIFFQNFGTNKIEINALNVGGTRKQQIENQSSEKKSENLGSYSLNIKDVKNTIFQNINLNINWSLSQIFYIKSENKFLCFVELDITDRVSTRLVGTEWLDDPDSYFIPWGESFVNFARPVIPDQIDIVNKKALYTTNNKVNICKDEAECPNCPELWNTDLKQKDEYEKKMISINIDGFETSFEVFTPKVLTETFSIDRNGSINSTFCGDGSIQLETEQLCATTRMSKQWTFDLNLEIKGWQKEDFSKDNVYPPKIS